MTEAISDLKWTICERTTSVRERWEQLNRVSTRLFVLSLLVMIVAIVIAYPLADRFGMGMQISAHIALTVAAGVLKLSYVLRLAAQEAIASE